jgi:hypothetical protein
MLGYLRETSELAAKAGIDKDFNLVRSGLDEYLTVTFPEVTDWVHDKALGNGIRTRPDYRSEELKLIVEFDGLPHYMNPDIIRKDKNNTEAYEKAGYTVVRVPLFIQLTSSVILRLFKREVSSTQVFPEDNVVSFSVQSRFTPAYIPAAGLARMASDFLKLAPEQLESNLVYLEHLADEFISGYASFKAIVESLNL